MQNVVSHCVEAIGNYKHLALHMMNLKGIDNDTETNHQQTAARAEAMESYMANSYMVGLNRNHYVRLIHEIHNAYQKGRDEYPKTLTTACNMAIICKVEQWKTHVTTNNRLYIVQGGDDSEPGGAHVTRGNGIRYTHWRKSLSQKIPREGKSELG